MMMGHAFVVLTFLVWTLGTVFVVAAEDQPFMRREHSLTRPFQGSGLGLPNWDISGSTMITAGYIRLTPTSPSQRGAIWNRVPVRARNWDLEVQFKVTGPENSMFGDGFSVWYARDRLMEGPVFGSKDFFSGLAIMVDTYSNHNGPHNHKHPYISAMINNGSLHYDHDTDGTHTSIGGCEVKFRNRKHDTFLRVTYKNEELSVFHNLDNTNSWTPCINVKSVRLPTGYYFGMSAETGELSDNHDILGVKMFELDGVEPGASESQGGEAGEWLNEDPSKVVPSAKFFEPARDHVDDPKPGMSGIKMFFLLLLGVLGCFACVVIGIMIYQKQLENSRKRFY